MMIGAAPKWRRAARIGRSIALLAALASSLGVGPALARDKLDQQNIDQHDTGTFGVSVGARSLSGQTFSAGRKGKLDRVGVDLAPNTSDSVPPGTIFAAIYPTDANGAPDTTSAPLGSGQVTVASFPQQPEMIFIKLKQAAKVAPGAVYALVVHTDGLISGDLSWFGSSGPGPDHYPAGNQASRPDETSPWQLFSGQDYFFQTFVARRHHRHHR